MINLFTGWLCRILPAFESCPITKALKINFLLVAAIKSVEREKSIPINDSDVFGQRTTIQFYVPISFGKALIVVKFSGMISWMIKQSFLSRDFTLFTKQTIKSL